MRQKIASSSLVFAFSIGLFASPAIAETPEGFLAALKTEASTQPGFKDFSAERGATFYKVKESLIKS